MVLIIYLVSAIARLLVLIVIVDAILSFFVSPFHPIRQALGGIINPMLEPIRRVVPPMGMIDFSPLVLVILIELVSSLLINVLRSLG